MAFPLAILALLLASPALAIDFFPTLDAAAEANPDDARTRVVIFGSQTCGWCRKLAADTLTHPKVTESESCFLWVKVDVDEQEDLAARYGVRGLPHVAVVDEHGHVLGEQPGYMTPDAFSDFLMTALTQPAPSATRMLDLLADLRGNDADNRRKSAKELLDLLSRVDSTGREQAVSELSSVEPVVWGEFVPYLSHPRLAIRATSHGLLMRGASIDLPFDPFAERPERETQAQAWVAWLTDHGIAAPALTFEAPAESTTWESNAGDEAPPPPVVIPRSAEPRPPE